MTRACQFLPLVAATLALAADQAFASGEGLHSVTLEARVAAKAAPLTRDVEWRVFREGPQAQEGREPALEPVASTQGGKASLKLAPGSYFLNAGYGQASRTLRLEVEGDTHRSIVLGAGGLKLDATSGGAAISRDLLRFDIYRHRRDEAGKRRIVAFDVAPQTVVRLNAGTYHVLSRYGRLRTEVRADLVVRAGQTTQAVLQHRGAEARFKLVSRKGGFPIANTAWSIFTDQGEQIHESASNAPRVVLPEGDYEVVARNGADVLKTAFTVEAGQPVDLELLLP